MLVRRVRPEAVHTWFAGVSLLVYPWRVLVDVQSCPVLCAGREFMLSCSGTDLCAAAAISSALLGGRVCALAASLLGCVLSVLCCSSGLALVHFNCCWLSMTGDQRVPAAECMSASIGPCVPATFPASSFLQGVTMHPSTELLCNSVWQLLLQRIHTDCMARHPAVDSRLWWWAPVSMHQVWVMSSAFPASLP
jgi:hypothetical protein